MSAAGASGQPGASRREALRRAALGGAAIAFAGLLRPAAAGAQTAADEELRDYLVEAISLEQLAVLAYATAGERGGALESSFTIFGDQEQAHANALRNALDSIGFDPPDAPDSTTDSAAFEDVEGLESEASERLVALLSELDRLSSERQFLDYLTKLEQQQLAFYTGDGAATDSVDLATTAAEIAGCQAQHLVVLGEARKQPAPQAARESARAAAEAIPAAEQG